MILQGHSTAALSEEAASHFRAAAIRAAHRAKREQAQVALYLTPAHASGHPLYAPDNIERIRGLYTALAEELGARLIPVGLAFDEALRQRPDLPLHVPGDYSHPTLAGTYLAAATVYASLYGRSPEGLRYDADGALDADTAGFLRRVAGSVALQLSGRS